MTLVPWRVRRELVPRRVAELSPWGSMRDVESYFNRFFEDTNGDFLEAFESEWKPAMDISETDEAYLIEADIPGLKKEDVKIEVMDDVVTIKGERKSEKEEKDKKKGYHRVERSYGGFIRTIRVPGGVKGDEVTAKFEDGVLKVTLPKPEEAKPKLISVSPN